MSSAGGEPGDASGSAEQSVPDWADLSYAGEQPSSQAEDTSVPEVGSSELTSATSSRGESNQEWNHPYQATEESNISSAAKLLSPRQQAFQVLVEAVRSLQERRRRTTAAGVKSEMQRMTAHGFSHAALGYASFRDFLEDAVREGLIQRFLPRASGQDVEILLPGDQSPNVEPSNGSDAVPLRGRDSMVMAGYRGHRRIRPDFWKAFVDWSPDKLRIYDVHRDRAVVLPHQQLLLEPEHLSQLRERWRQDPQQFREIQPISLPLQLGWIRDFVSALSPGQAKDVLTSALQGERPVAAFTASLRGFPNLNRSWQDRRLELVANTIEDWRRAQNLNFEIWASEVSATDRIRKDDLLSSDSGPAALSRNEEQQQDLAGIPGRSSPISAAALHAGGRNYDELVRLRIKRALDRMPLSELLRIRVPIEYLIDP